MKQKKLRGYVLPTIYVVALMLIFGTVSLVSILLKDNPNYLYSIGILSKNSQTVMGDNNDTVKEEIIKPFNSESVSVDKYFYDNNSDEEKQIKSLIYFENTYMKNTGVLYQSAEAFDVVSVLNGKVANIKQDEIMGNVVEIDHNTNLKTIYYSLDQVNLKVGDEINQGDLVGISGSSRITENKYNLLFEVYYNGTLMNPEEFYKMDIKDLS